MYVIRIYWEKIEYSYRAIKIQNFFENSQKFQNLKKSPFGEILIIFEDQVSE